jgi:hypothetical protein
MITRSFKRDANPFWVFSVELLTVTGVSSSFF